MKKLHNAVIWLIKNSTNICLIFVVLVSLHPFVSDNHGHNYYTALGIFFTFISAIFTRWHIKDGIKESNFYNILCIIIMAIGVGSIFVISGKLEKSPYTDFQLFMATYFGALLGLAAGTFINDLLDSSNKEKELLKQKVQNLNKVKVKLNWIPVTKKLPYEDKEVLCKNSKGAYFVGYLTSENVGHKIIYQCNSGDEGMNDVVCWIELSEIEKTVPDELLIK